MQDVAEYQDSVCNDQGGSFYQKKVIDIGDSMDEQKQS